MKLFPVITKEERGVEAKQRAARVATQLNQFVSFSPECPGGAVMAPAPVVHALLVCCGHGFRAHPARSRLPVLPVFLLLTLLGRQAEQQE